MLQELIQVMDEPLAGASLADIADAIEGRNILAKRTQSGRHEAGKKLRRRYRLDPQDPVFSAFVAAWQREDRSDQRALLAYLLYATRDGFFRHFVAEWLSPRLAVPGTIIKPEDVTSFIERLALSDPNVAKWGAKTRDHVAKHALTAIGEFGLAEGDQTKRLTRPVVGGVVAWYAARIAALQKLSERDIPGSEWFRLLGLDLERAMDALSQLNDLGLGRFRVVGGVVQVHLAPLGGGDDRDDPAAR